MFAYGECREKLSTNLCPSIPTKKEALQTTQLQRNIVTFRNKVNRINKLGCKYQWFGKQAKAETPVAKSRAR
jgi:hypothetical protein